MNRFDAAEEKLMCRLLDQMTAREEFWKLDDNPFKIGFQRFGLQLREEDLEQQGVPCRGFLVRDRNEVRKANSGSSVVRNGEKEFRIELDVWPFQRDEISVMVVPGKYVTIRGEHGERSEDGSECTRKFQRYYHLPRGSKSDRVKCEYCNGIVVIKVPKEGVADEMYGPRIVPVTLVGCRTQKPPVDEERYIPEPMPVVQNVPVGFENDTVADHQRTTTEDSEGEESSQSESEEELESPKRVSATTEDSNGVETSMESSVDKDESAPIAEVAESSVKAPVANGKSTVDIADEKDETSTTG